ncbi:LAMI_0C01772g1_1 [Lachancea mirantina]|uniref:Lactoylglutathione lyase n=1 Tax=Lachancea mirantina TaxID=1230905 RepID=A0A1G4J0F4_9SACH|nr:LAMI_0C01772g1_1 [Lachancea mirantina]
MNSVKTVVRPLQRSNNIHFLRKMATESIAYPTLIKAASQNSSLRLNHSCVRIKNPETSLKFYTSNFGMTLVGHKKFPDMKFDLYFLSFPKTPFPQNEKGEDDVFGVSGVLELTHNYGTEDDPDFKVNNGNEEPFRGFGHICFSLPDVEKTCAELEANGVAFKKRLSDGRQKNIAFALDPDGYWIELLSYNRSPEVKPIDEGYKFNHTMVRIKDPAKSLGFYQNVLGMKLLDKNEHANAKFTLYFLGYDTSDKPRWAKEGILELTHNWGTENEADFHYHTGNDKPQGYGHICLSLDDPAALCHEIESVYGESISWGVKFNHGKMKNLAFIKDPDGYSIEIVPCGLIA